MPTIIVVIMPIKGHNGAMVAEVRARELNDYLDEKGTAPYRTWLDSLSIADQVIIEARLARVRQGALGDCESVGDGVVELRIHEGPGFRVYFGQDGPTLVILLVGGTKRKQQKDIKTARKYWADYKRRKS